MKLAQRKDKCSLHVVKTGFKVTGVSSIRYRGKEILTKGEMFGRIRDRLKDDNSERSYAGIMPVRKGISKGWSASNIRNNRMDGTAHIKYHFSEKCVKPKTSTITRESDQKHIVHVQAGIYKEEKDTEGEREQGEFSKSILTYIREPENIFETTYYNFEKKLSKNDTLIPDKITNNKVSTGKVSIDKVPVDRVSVNKVPVGRVSVDKVPVNQVSVDKVSVGKVPIDRVLADKASVNRVSIDNVSDGRVSADKALVNRVSIDNVSDGRVSADKASVNRVSIDNVSVDKGSIGEVSDCKSPISLVGDLYDREKSKISSETKAKFCNVNAPKTAYKMPGVAKKEDKIRSEVEEEDISEPWVCSKEEREKIRGKQLQYKSVHVDSINAYTTDKKKTYKDNVKKRLLREYVIREMIHDQGKNNPNAHFKLIGQMITYDAAKVISRIMKLILTLISKLLLMILPVILIASVVAMVFVGLYMKMESPATYFDGYYDSIQEVRENPEYIKNVIQELERDFAGDIEYFLSVNGLNETTYAYGQYSEADDVVSAYLAQITTDPNYSRLLSTETEGYPAYLFVDTNQEKKLLKKIFKQFNYTEKEAVKKKVTNEEGKEEEKDAEKMTVYCLTMEKWKEEYGAELSEPAQTILADLMQKNVNVKSEGNENFVTGEAVPIQDLVIPEGVDENLIYLAGFIRAEAGNQSYIGKTAVAYVILNRAGGATGNIKWVLTAPYQFSCYIPYHTVEKYLYAYVNMSQEQREADSCYKAAAGAYYGTSENPIGDMKYYCNPKYCSAGEVRQWEKIRARNTEEQIKIIGDHVFCQNCW